MRKRPCTDCYGSPVSVEPVVNCFDETYPVPRPPILAPYHEPAPPPHTQIQPRCFTCKHFEMCKFKKDYLKMITLMQNKLGAPQQDFELTNKYITIPKFVGFPFADWDKYLPKEVEFDNSDNKGKFFSAKFNGINFVNIVYKDCKYYILLEFVYEGEKKEVEEKILSADPEPSEEDEYVYSYKLKSCKEAFYQVPYELNKESEKVIQENLLKWREVIINARMPAPVPPPPRPDIIDTTHFSAQLNCDMYEWNRDSFEDAVEKMNRKYPNGIPIDDDGRALYHIKTYHIENAEVPYAPLYMEKPPKKPHYYFPPKKDCPCPKPPKRRDDL